LQARAVQDALHQFRVAWAHQASVPFRLK